MGYSHFYTQKKNFSIKEWHSFMEFVERLSHYNPTICGPDGTEHPVITENDIMFNGDFSCGDSCDTFHVSRVRPGFPYGMEKIIDKDKNKNFVKKYKGFRFCKTNRKPYDASVVASLIFITNMNEKIMNVNSDGQISDWHEGCHLCRAVYKHMDVIIPEFK
jgi:Fe-S-cluster containining protein